MFAAYLQALQAAKYPPTSLRGVQGQVWYPQRSGYGLYYYITRQRRLTQVGQEGRRDRVNYQDGRKRLQSTGQTVLETPL